MDIPEKSQEWLTVFKSIEKVLKIFNFPEHCLRPKQVECLQYMLQGYDVVAQQEMIT